MIEANLFTWIIAIFGVVTFTPLLAAQLLMLLNPQSQKTKDLIIGKGEGWRDRTHYKSALAFAWADWLIIFPLIIISYIGVFKAESWGYVLWLALGILSIYFSIIFWVMEKKHSYPSVGKLVYFTYFWGFFFYWGIGAIIYSFIQII